MITAGDLRKGLTFEWDGDVWVVIDFQHVKPGKGAAFVRSKIKSVLTGGIKDTTFNPSEKFEKVVIENKEMQYFIFWWSTLLLHGSRNLRTNSTRKGHGWRCS